MSEQRNFFESEQPRYPRQWLTHRKPKGELFRQKVKATIDAFMPIGERRKRKRP